MSNSGFKTFIAVLAIFGLLTITVTLIFYNDLPQEGGFTGTTVPNIQSRKVILEQYGTTESDVIFRDIESDLIQLEMDYDFSEDPNLDNLNPPDFGEKFQERIE